MLNHVRSHIRLCRYNLDAICLTRPLPVDLKADAEVVSQRCSEGCGESSLQNPIYDTSTKINNFR